MVRLWQDYGKWQSCKEWMDVNSLVWSAWCSSVIENSFLPIQHLKIVLEVTAATEVFFAIK